MSLLGHVLNVHDKLYKATDGRVGHRLIGVPTLLLRTTGRKSGQERTNSIVYVRDGQDYVIVASNGGADRPPAWLHNIRADGHVGIQVGRKRQQATARIVESSDPDYERLWKLANAHNSDRYAAYQTKTSRPIAVVAITPG